MITSAGHRTFKFVEKEYINQGSLIQLFTILQRTQGTTDANNVFGKENFMPVLSAGNSGQIMGRMEVIKPSHRFAGISIDGEVITHIGYTNFDLFTFNLGVNSLFIDVSFPYQSRRFKVLAITDYSEMQKFLEYYCTDRGFNNLPAAGI